MNNSYTDMMLKESALSMLYTDVDRNSLQIENFLFISWTTELDFEVVLQSLHFFFSVKICVSSCIACNENHNLE